MKILVVNVNWIGDVLFSTPLLRCLRKKFPDAYIASIVAERAGDVLKFNPYLDEVIHLDPNKEREFPWFDFGLLTKLRKERFNISIHLHRSFTRRLYAYFSGIRERIGYEEKMRGFLLTKKLQSQRDRVHRVKYYFKLGEALGIEDDGEGLDLFISDEEIKKVKGLLEEFGLERFVLIHIGANWPAKRWSQDKWGSLIDLIRGRLGIHVVITGTSVDLSTANQIRERTSLKPISLVGKTSLRELMALIKLADLFIGVDSAPYHIAYALGTKAIGLYGPTSPSITGPYRPKGEAVYIHKERVCKVPCYLKECPYDFKCMKQINVEEVLSLASDLLR
jgi:lipopolysaccharide heptosyltransferase II